MTIKDKLDAVISSMSDFSKQTNMVAINASIHAGRLSQKEGAPFQVLAREIQNMSAQSIEKLAELDQLVKEVGEMSRLINQAGRQRMILMKLVNGKLIENQAEVGESKELFEENLSFIRASSINSPECLSILDDIDSKWKELVEGFEDRLQHELMNDVNQLIVLLNQLLSHYEKFAGQ